MIAATSQFEGDYALNLFTSAAFVLGYRTTFPLPDERIRSGIDNTRLLTRASVIDSKIASIWGMTLTAKGI